MADSDDYFNSLEDVIDSDYENITDTCMMEMNSPDESDNGEDSYQDTDDSELECESGDEVAENIEAAAHRKRGRPFGSSVDCHLNYPGDETMETPVRKKRRSLKALTSFAYMVCCSMLCISGLDIMTAETVRNNFQSLSTNERSQFILNWLQSHSRINELTCKYEFKYLIGTSSVCLSAFLLVLGIPKSTYYSIQKKFYDGSVVINKIGNRLGRMKASSQSAMTWLHMYAIQFGEKLPNQEKIHLPPCVTKKSIYSEMVEYQHDKGEPEVISMSHFMLLWRTCLCHIAIPKVSRFSKCNKCIKIKTKLSSTRSKTKKQELQRRREKHLKQQNMERRKYYKHIQKAKEQPEKYLSVIIDSMDQSKTQLPHFLYKSKFTGNMWKLRVHLIGVLLHGISTYGFFDLFEYPHSANLTISTLINILAGLEDIPPVLYLQMDNCYRENKNRFVFGFLSLLVELGVFKKVKVSFLMVGHTHEDVDQVFSRFSSWLARQAVLTLPKLMRAFESCTTPNPVSVQTSKVWDTAGWISQYLNKMCNHSYPHIFKIIKKDEKTRLFYKKWSTDKTWQEPEEQLLLSVPTDSPKIIIPDYNKIDLAKLKNDITGSFSYFKREEDKKWWTDFFTDLSSNNESPEEAVWPLSDLIEKAKERDMKETSDTRQLSDSELSDVSDEDEPIPQLVVGKKKSGSQGDNSTIVVSVGEMVLLNLAEYEKEWPQVAQVINSDEETCMIHWFRGSQTKPWKPCSRAIPGKKGKREAWTQTINITEIIRNSFCLTKGGFLPKNVKEFCKSHELQAKI
ncbi:uncharacterized protein LOC134720824 isoform X3 [Mytilus trossulus]|uniref:uncharacterized protein LOC134720824 isoform X3 n=1 Tax=Mytilus trossulus TaxID=6551 RepID=UPI0030041903